MKWIAIILLVSVCEASTDHKEEEIDCSIQRKCSLEPNYVCGGNETERRTFENNCVFSNYHCRERTYKKINDGPCEVCKSDIIDYECTSQPRCADYYQPVCGGNEKFQKDYLNDCLLWTYACSQEKEKLRRLKNGPCKTPCSELAKKGGN